MLKTWKNTIHAAMKPSTARVMVGKVIKRFADKKGALDHDANKQWLQAHAQDLETFLAKFDQDIQNEVRTFQTQIKAHAQKVLSAIPYDLGGGGGVPLLYALTRKLKPEVVVETGVAAGFSSATILAAMEKNGAGRLFSSDFPYFRLPNPEKYVGVVVEDVLKARWALYLQGDEANLPEIVDDLPTKVGIFHYDSDKSYNGRDFAMKTIQPQLAKDAIVIMDDIQDNSYFHYYVSANTSLTWSVFLYEGKYIGIIGRVF